MTSVKVTALDVTTLVIAVFGAVTAMASLVWQLANHHLTGARVKVHLRAGWLGMGGAVTMPWDQFREAARPEGVTGPTMVAVEVRNVGRLPCSVMGWGVGAGGTILGHVQTAYKPRGSKPS